MRPTTQESARPLLLDPKQTPGAATLQTQRGPATAPLIELQHVDKVYRVGDMNLQVLRDVSLAIEAGEFVALMGVSGSGKTTLMNLLGLPRPSKRRRVPPGRRRGKSAKPFAVGAASQQPDRFCISKL